MKILMCPPQHYDVTYQINPWMTRAVPVDKGLATRQWQALEQSIRACGAEVVLVAPQPGLPDMVFTANAALILQHQVYLAQFSHPERQPERAHFLRFFTQHGYVVHGVAGDETVDNVEEPVPVTDSVTSAPDQTTPFEGAGDALNLGNKLFLGHGFRSQSNCHLQIANCFPDYQCISLELVDPHFYHLDTCFCPLDADSALLWPEAFSPDSQKLLKDNVPKLLCVPASEAKQFACNAVVLGRKVIIPSGCPQTAGLLQQHGWQVQQCDLSEFIKAGGAAKCLTLNLDQN